MTKHETQQHFRSFKLGLLESIDCFTNDFEQLKQELEDALHHVNNVLEND